MPPLITVAICTRNRAGLLEKAVRSVLAQSAGNAEILVVDNGSTDDTARRVAALSAADPRVKFFCEPQTGLSVARNSALRQASGEWVIFFDDDAEAEPGWLAAYEIFFSNLPNARIAVVGGGVISQSEIPPPKWMGEMPAWTLGPKPFSLVGGENPRECNCAYRRDVALQTGGFDARLGHQGNTAGYHEGPDLNIRLQNVGYEIWWLPGAAIRHLIHANRLNLRSVLNARFHAGRSAAIRRLKTRAGARRVAYITGRLLIVPPHCAINLLAAVVALPFQNGRLTVKALVRLAHNAGLTQELLRQIFVSWCLRD